MPLRAAQALEPVLRGVQNSVPLAETEEPVADRISYATGRTLLGSRGSPSSLCWNRRSHPIDGGFPLAIDSDEMKQLCIHFRHSIGGGFPFAKIATQDASRGSATYQLKN